MSNATFTATAAQVQVSGNYFKDLSAAKEAGIVKAGFANPNKAALVALIEDYNLAVELAARKAELAQAPKTDRANTGAKGADREKLIALLQAGATKADLQAAMNWSSKTVQNHITYVKWWGFTLVRQGNVYQIV